MPVSSLLNDLGKAVADRPATGRASPKSSQKVDFGSALADSERRISRERHVEEKQGKETRPSSRHPARHDRLPAHDPAREVSDSHEETRPKVRSESSHDDARGAERRDDLRSNQAAYEPSREKTSEPADTSTEPSSEAKTASQSSENTPTNSDAGTTASQAAVSETAVQNPVAEMAALLQAQLNTPANPPLTKIEASAEAELVALQAAAKPDAPQTGDAETMTGETIDEDQTLTTKTATAAPVVAQSKNETASTKQGVEKPAGEDTLQAVASTKAGTASGKETAKTAKTGSQDAAETKNPEQTNQPHGSKSEKAQPQSAATETFSQTISEKNATPVTPEVSANSVKPAESVEQSRPTSQTAALSRADTPVPLQAVAVEIGMRAMRGSKEFSIRLDPEDLGRIDIKLEISEAGEIQAKLTVDRVETLQMLQRDAKTLERAFDQAGLKSNPDGLQFSLRDPGQNRDGQQGDQGQARQQNRHGKDEQLIPDDIAMKSFRYMSPATSGLDIRI